MLKLFAKEQQQEGFFSSQHPSQFIQVNFIPFFPKRQKKDKSKSYMNKMKLQPFLQPKESSLINNRLSLMATEKMIKKYKNKRISNVNKDEMGLNRAIVRFDSNFESGNLQYVIEEGNNQYHLFMKPDTNTMGYFQWFYFKVNNQSLHKITIIIKNFVKKNILYKKGLRPYFRSLKSKKMIYQQISEKTEYYEENEDGQARYALKFTYNFQNLYDQVEFCSQPPYTYSQLQKFTISLPFKTIQIATTIMGNKIQAFVINQEKDYQAMVVVMARQHPGQSVGSWMMQGFLNCLKKMQNNIFWLIIPMINIDGVIVGNNRTGLLGYDFNRNWNVDEDPYRSTLIPQLKGILRYCRSFKKQGTKKIKMMIDFHGHSSQENVFSYGPSHLKTSQLYNLSRLFPYMINKKNKNFNLQKCNYEIKQGKKNCSRAVFLNKLGFNFSYTIQSSFGVYRHNSINQNDLLTMGRDICMQTIHFLYLITIKQQKQNLDILLNQMNPQLKDSLMANDNSDDDQQDQNQPNKKQFFQKVINLLANPNNYRQQAQKLREKYNLSVQKESLKQKQKQKQKQKERERENKKRKQHFFQQQYVIVDKKQKSLSLNSILVSQNKYRRIKTQKYNSGSKNGDYKKSIIGLPSIKMERNEVNQGISQNYFKHKMSCEFTKLKGDCRLFNMKESTIGRQIIVLKGFRNNHQY